MYEYYESYSSLVCILARVEYERPVRNSAVPSTFYYSIIQYELVCHMHTLVEYLA